jgi:hypothetical protein
MAHKSSQAVVLKRINEVLDLRLSGATNSDIRLYATQQGWNLARRQLGRYMAQADAEINKSLERDREKLFDWHLAVRRYLYARAVQLADFATALRILKDEAELTGLYPPRKLEHAGPQSGPILFRNVRELSDVELHAIAAGEPEPEPDPPRPGRRRAPGKKDGL